MSKTKQFFVLKDFTTWSQVVVKEVIFIREPWRQTNRQKHTSITDIGLQEQNHEAHHKHAKVKIAMLTKTWIKVPI